MVRHEGKKKPQKDGKETFTYSCCQSSTRVKKAKVARDKARATRRRPRFPCGGWLHLTVLPESDVIELTIKHLEVHPPYVDAKIPEEWRAYIEKQAKIQVAGEVRACEVYQHRAISDLAVDRTRSGSILFAWSGSGGMPTPRVHGSDSRKSPCITTGIA